MTKMRTTKAWESLTRGTHIANEDLREGTLIVVDVDLRLLSGLADLLFFVLRNLEGPASTKFALFSAWRHGGTLSRGAGEVVTLRLNDARQPGQWNSLWPVSTGC